MGFRPQTRGCHSSRDRPETRPELTGLRGPGALPGPRPVQSGRRPRRWLRPIALVEKSLRPTPNPFGLLRWIGKLGRKSQRLGRIAPLARRGSDLFDAIHPFFPGWPLVKIVEARLEPIVQSTLLPLVQQERLHVPAPRQVVELLRRTLQEAVPC